MALCASAASQAQQARDERDDSPTSPTQHPPLGDRQDLAGMITHDVFLDILTQMKKSAVS